MFTIQHQYKLGIGLVVMTTALRVASSFLMSTIFEEDEYSMPLLVTLINSALFVVIFGAKKAIIFFVTKGTSFLVSAEHRTLCTEHPRTTSAEDGLSSYVSIRSDIGARHHPLIAAQSTTLSEDEDSPLLAETRPSSCDPQFARELNLTATEAAIIGLKVSPLWFLSNYLLALSFAHTTVSSVTIITATGSAWVLLLNAISSHIADRITTPKILSVALAIMGACIVAANPIPTADTPPSPSHPEAQPKSLQLKILLGDTTAMIASMIHAFYTVWLSGQLRGRKVTLPTTLFATIGAASVVLFGPVLILLSYLGWEKVSIPHDASTKQIGVVCAMILGNATISALVDILWVSGMVKTSPLIAIIGTKLTIPLAMLVQVVWLEMRPDVWYCVGAGCVCVGFGLMIWKGP